MNAGPSDLVAELIAPAIKLQRERNEQHEEDRRRYWSEQNDAGAVDDFKWMAADGIAGVLAQCCTLEEAKRYMTVEQFERFSAAIGLPAGSPAHEKLYHVGERCAQLRDAFGEHSAEFALLKLVTSPNEREFQSLLQHAGDNHSMQGATIRAKVIEGRF
jgi:hypothetical protein